MPYATNAGVRIYYEVEGSGPALMLHAEFVGSGADWHENGYVAALKGENQLILIDPRGQGESDKPHEPSEYSGRLRVADVIAVLDALGIERLDFLGYSMGARVGFELGLQAPQRCASLMLGGASPFGGPPNVAWAALLRQGMETFLADLDRRMGPQPAGVRGRAIASDGEALAAAILLERPSLEAALPGLALPVLLYCGELDPSFKLVARAATLMPAAEFVPLPGLNHRQGWLDGAATLPHVTSFLRKVRGKG